MTQPTPGDVHVNTPLTNISVAFMQKATSFIADQVFPIVPVSHQSDRYYTYNRGDFNRDEMALRGPGAESAGGTFKVDNTPTYYAPVWAFHHDIDDQRRANSDSVLAPDREATQFVTNKALIKKEKLWVAKYFVTGIWGTSVAGVATPPGASQFLQWNDAASDPIKDIRTGMTAVTLKSGGLEPNVLVLGRAVFDALIDHPDIVDRVKYGQSGVGRPASVGVEELAALFKVERVLVMNAVENSAPEGATEVQAFIGGKKALLVHAAPNPGLMVPTGGYTFSWTGYLGATQQGTRIKKFRMEGNASDRVEIEAAFDQKLVAADCGYFFDTAVA